MCLIFFWWPTLLCPCVVVHSRTSLMNLSLHSQQCSGYIGRLTKIVCEMRGKWPYNCYSVGCCFQHLLQIACSILALLTSSFFQLHSASCVGDLKFIKGIQKSGKVYSKHNFFLFIMSNRHLESNIPFLILGTVSCHLCGYI